MSSQQQKSREELEQTVERLEKRVDSLTKFIHTTFKTEVNERLEDHDEKIADVESLAQNAIGIAQAEAKTDANAQSKKGTAVRLIRRRLVKDAHRHSSSKAGVTTSTVQEMGQPDVDLARRTIHDAFDDLQDAWDAFEHDEGKPGPNGRENRLKCDGNELDPSLIRGVAESLTNDDLRESLIMCAESGGGL